MICMEFIWNNRKAKSNLTKHGVSFEDAKSVFLDDYARLKHDPDHSIDEDRYLLLGMSSSLKVLVVVHTEIGNDTIRLISARKATWREAKQYRRFKP
ncbi:MAG: BrnT family toxin [Desulfobacterales bacterium]|nr:BrnT family toxin [Desulfobacterales bacterium]